MSGDGVVGLLIGVATGVVLGALLGITARSRRLAASEARLAEVRRDQQRSAESLESARAEAARAREDLARCVVQLDIERRSAEERATAWEDDRQRLAGTFAELSAHALQQNAEQFISLAESRLAEAHVVARGDLAQRQQAIAESLRPLGNTLARYEEALRRLEIDRKEAYAGLKEQVGQIRDAHDRLHRETRNLVTALRAPQTRGRWGEMQLRRVVEVAGMVEHCDFDEQVAAGEEGRFRPDVVVHLPGGAQVVVDAKVPLDAFLHAAETDDDDVRRSHYRTHARQLRAHVDQLAKKQYWSQFEPSPEFVVAFVPGDPLLAAAFEHDAGLIEHALANRVLLATPTTLIALLRTVALSWQQEALAENARVVQRLGAELHERLRVLAGHFGRLQRHVAGTVEAFNDVVGSFESRVLVTARRFSELGVVGPSRELGDVQPVLSTPRPPRQEAAGAGPQGGTNDPVLADLPGRAQQGPPAEVGAGDG